MKKRKLISITLDESTINILEILSKKENINKSRFIENLILNKTSSDENYIYASNSAGPIAIPISEIISKVKKAMKDE